MDADAIIKAVQTELQRHTFDTFMDEPSSICAGRQKLLLLSLVRSLRRSEPYERQLKRREPHLPQLGVDRPVMLALKTNLKLRPTAILLFCGVLIAASLLSPKHLSAHGATVLLAQSQEQSPPQPAGTSKQPPRTTLAGSWKLNRDESDDARQVVRDEEPPSSGTTSRYPAGGAPGGGYPGGGYPGGGYPGGGNPGGGGYPGGGRGGYPSGGQQNSGPNIEDNPKMQPLIHPSGLLTIELKNPEIDVTDYDLHKLSLYTDGRKLQKSKDNNDQEVAAHWDGSRLVSDEKSPLGGKMSRTFELSQDGRKLFETLRIANGRSDTPIIIHYVYDIVGSDTKGEQDSDPNGPVLKRNPDDGASPR